MMHYLQTELLSTAHTETSQKSFLLKVSDVLSWAWLDPFEAPGLVEGHLLLARLQILPEHLDTPNAIMWSWARAWHKCPKLFDEQSMALAEHTYADLEKLMELRTQDSGMFAEMDEQIMYGEDREELNALALDYPAGPRLARRVHKAHVPYF